jgi:arylsulfatase A-like enzyme
MNIFLLISDTFRYDNLFDRSKVMPVHTPNLDAFSERAVSLSQMYISSFPTIPHRTDLTSGRHTWLQHPWADRTVTTENHLPIVLGKQGYITQLICDCPHLFNSRFNEGFTAAEHIRGQEGDVYFTRMNHEIPTVMPETKTRQDDIIDGHNLPDLHTWTAMRNYREIDRFAPRTATRAMEWLEENYQRKDLFLWVDFFDPHEPFDPPEYMVRKYDPTYKGTPMIHPNYGRSSDYTKAELKNIRAHYAAEAQLVDRWVGRVLEKIDDLDLWDDSIVIFTADHGMSFGEHGRVGKTNINPRDDRYWPLYPEVAHVPFMVAAPGLKGGREVAGLTQPVDIVPTILDLAGLSRKAKTPEPMHGQSFAPLLRGTKSATGRDFVVSGSLPLPDEFEPDQLCRFIATPVLYTDKYAYVPFGPKLKPELFDMKRDPGCTRNIAGQKPAVAKRLHKQFLTFLTDNNMKEEALKLVMP